MTALGSEKAFNIIAKIKMQKREKIKEITTAFKACKNKLFDDIKNLRTIFYAEIIFLITIIRLLFLQPFLL